ncbi:MAG TPA: hypothetical protein DCY91_19345 [Cyanobacteria bacterium UBA11370]|nr:hypothetical protein [Cyanobacteria bacterium UBA11370]
MSVTFKHFDTRLNQWIHTDGNPDNPETILTETLDNTLLETYFPGVEFSFGHIDDKSKAEDLYNHPEGHVLLLSSKSRLLYGPAECLETIDKLCPDRKDRGAYGSIFLGSCKNALTKELNILVVNDETGENGGILADAIAWRQVGDCHGKISPELSQQLSDSVEHVIQHRLAIPSEYRFAKGTLAPKDLTQLPYQNPNTPPIDLIVPTSSFKGGDKENNPIQPGLHTVTVWIGEKEHSQQGTIAASQVHASFPEGIKDFLTILEEQAQTLKKIQDDPRKLAQYYCEKYEKRKGLLKNRSSELEEDQVEGTQEGEIETDPVNDQMMYRLIKADLEGDGQLLETQKVTDELKRFLQKEWRDIAIGKTIEFERGMIIPSKDLKHGEICVTYLPEGEEILNFRSPLLNSNGMCISTNKIVEDAYAPNGKPLKGVIVVNDEDQKRIQARINALKIQGIETSEIVPIETESERQGRDYDGDCIGVELASKYPTFTNEARKRNEPENAYAPVKKEQKASFHRADGSQPPFEEIALFMSDSISVGVINNHATALEALESEIDIINTQGTPQQKADYLRQVGNHYQTLIQQENDSNNPQPLKLEYRDRIIQVAQIAQSPLTDELINQGLKINRSIYHDMIGEAGYQNQLAVDIFKSNRAPDIAVIKENQRLLHRIPEYIRDKKSPDVYMKSGIKAEGYSPVELMVRQTNTLFEQSQLESRPTEQFRDLFPETFTPAQKNQATLTKAQFDQLFNEATKQDRKRQIEQGPVLKVTTQKGAELEITNVIKFDHPDLGKIDTMNLKLVENERPKSRIPHKLIALAQVKGEVGEEGKAVYKRLGTVCEISRTELGLKAGISTHNARLKLAAPLTERQCKLLFQKAKDYAQSFRESLPEDQRLAMAAATWNICTSPENAERNAQGKTIKPNPNQKQNYKISHFAFAAFSEEIIEQVGTLQFTELTATGINRESNQLKDEVWKKGQDINLEIRVRDDLPVEDPRYNKRLLFVLDPEQGEYQEFGIVDTKGGQLPIGTKAQATISADLVATANLHINHPQITQPIKFGKVNDCELAFHPFNGETYQVSLEQYQPPPIPVIKLDGKVIGELDAGSVEMLKNAYRLQEGQTLDVALNTYGRNNGTHTLATTSHGNTIRANRQVQNGDFKDYRFNGEQATITIGFKQAKPGMAVKININGEKKVAGLFTPNQKESKEALTRAGLFQAGVTFEAKITSNVTIASVKIKPETVEYPTRGEWIKQRRATQQHQDNQQSVQQQTASSLITNLKRQPSILHQLQQEWEMPSGEIQQLPTLGLTVDQKVADSTSKWLNAQGVTHIRVNLNHPSIEPETERGYAVFRMVEADVPPQVRLVMKQQCGEAIDANFTTMLEVSPYHQRLEAVPKLNPCQLDNLTKTQEPTGAISPPKRQLPTLLSRENTALPPPEGSSESISPFKATQSETQTSPNNSKPYNPLANLTPLNRAVAHHMKKDIAMAEVATQFIGTSAAPPNTPSSTRNYSQAWGDRANTGVYSPDDTIMVSGSGPWRGVEQAAIESTFESHYKPLLNQALKAGSSFVVGNAKGTDQLVQEYLKNHGYKLEATPNHYIKATPERTKIVSPDHSSQSENGAQPVQISGKPVKMVYELKLHGEENPLPVTTTIDAMRGHGRCHTTRTYPPDTAYGFQEGDIALAVAGEKQVAFRVGKQYPITQQMIADPQYREQWASLEKHSAKELDSFQGKEQVWGLYMEPLGDYIDGKIVPFADVAAQTQKASQTQQAQTAVTSTQSESLIAQAIQQQRTELVAAVVAKTLDLAGTHHHQGTKYTADWNPTQQTLTLTPVQETTPVMVAKLSVGNWQATPGSRLSHSDVEFFQSIIPLLQRLEQQHQPENNSQLTRD